MLGRVLGTLLLPAGQQEPERPVRSQAQGHRVWTDTRTMAKLVECVPNFSEGCNKEVRIGDGMRRGAGSWACLAASFALLLVA